MVEALTLRDVVDRAEHALNATREWREAAKAALDLLPRGGRARCCEAVGCSPGQLTLLLQGHITSSVYVGPISDWLRIPRPAQVAMSRAASRVNEFMRKASKAQGDLIVSLVDELERGAQRGADDDSSQPTRRRRP